MRIKGALFAAVFAATCAACAPTTPGLSGVLAEIPGFTVTEICPAEVDPALAAQDFDRLAAALVSQNGNPMLRVLGGQLKNGSGEPFIRTYVGNLSDRTAVGVGVPSEPTEIGGHVLTHFNIPLQTEGYAYADGPTVVIAYVAAGAPPATVEAALTEVLGNV